MTSEPEIGVDFQHEGGADQASEVFSMNFEEVLDADKSNKQTVESEADVSDLDEQYPITIYEKE